MYPFYQPVSYTSTLYAVRYGDTLKKIAAAFNVSPEDLVSANPHISGMGLLFPGQVICIPVVPCCPKEVDGFIYTVLPEDTLPSIAGQFNITAEDILNANPYIKDTNMLFTGQRICILKKSDGLPVSLILKADQSEGLTVPLLGSVLINCDGENKYSVTFTAVNMPHPLTLGDYNRLIGTINIINKNKTYNVILNRIIQEGQPEVWSGSTIIPFSPRSGENQLTICPYNIENNNIGPVLVRGFMGKSRV